VKKILLFPEENVVGNPIWRVTSSLFQFANRFNECNNVISENKSLTTLYTISTTPPINITCTKMYYNEIAKR
jgi:hypothetical protein